MQLSITIRFIKFSFIASCFLCFTSCQNNTSTQSAPANHNLQTSFVENSTSLCRVPALVDYSDLKEIAKLPNPFISLSGKPIDSVNDWRCRRAEMSAQLQKYELGIKPADGKVTAAHLADTQFTVTVMRNRKTISFTAKIKLPKTGKPPFPAVIGIGNSWLNNDDLQNAGVALIAFPNDDLAEQWSGKSRGKGAFYELYGSDHTASAMTAWAWGVSRLIDALGKNPTTKIDSKHLAVTGCSRNGKGAIVAGALDERIVLTIAQESGSGGAAGWRVSDAQMAAGEKVQTLQEIVQENVWFTENFKQFSTTAMRLPVDQHSLMSLIAPRALLVIENTSMEWLGNQSAYINAIAAHEVWKALGVAESMGVSQVGGHNHCQLPASQYSDVNNFVKKFLLGDKTVDTNLQKTDGTFNQDLSAWVDWKTPRLK